MHLYFAGYTTGPEHFAALPKATHLLESFLTFRKRDYRAYHEMNGLSGRKLFLDSGAFTAFTKGETVNLDEYCDFIGEHEDMLTVYAALDVIGDYEATRKNQERMEKRGLKPLPTFHYQSPFSELERLCKHYPYIALGGLVPIAMRRSKMRAWLDACFLRIPATVKVHGFGVNSLWAWERYPWHSVDATSWLAPGKYGRTYVFEDRRLRPIPGMEKVTYEVRNKQAIIAFLRAQRYINDLWQHRRSNPQSPNA